MKKKSSDTTLGTKHVQAEPRNQYVYCPERRGAPHVAIAVCRSDKCGKYATCRAGGLDEETEAKPKAKVAKATVPKAPRKSALERILEGGEDI